MQTKNKAQAIAGAVITIVVAVAAISGFDVDPEVAAGAAAILGQILAAVIAWLVPERNPAPSARLVALADFKASGQAA